MTALAATPGNARPPPRLRLHAHGRAHRRVDAARRQARSTELSPTLQSLAPRRGSPHRPHQPGAAERLSRHPRDLQRRLPQRRQGEVDREHRLLPRHHRRSDRRASRSAGKRGCRRSNSRWICSPRSASATTATPASTRTISPGPRPPRRSPPRLIRASSSSGSSATAAAPPTAAPSCGRDASLLDWVPRRHRAPAEEARPGDRTKVDAVPRHRARSGAPHPESRSRHRRLDSCPISTARSACPPPTPITRG